LFVRDGDSKKKRAAGDDFPLEFNFPTALFDEIDRDDENRFLQRM
jgi:hypothetical protein